MRNYHLTEAGAAWSVGSTDLPPGFYPADEDGRSADAYVAPGDYVAEWARRRLDYADPQSDGCLRAAIAAHRAGEPLPPAPAPGEVRWQPPPAEAERSCGGCGDVGPVAAHHNGVPYCQGCEDAPSEADDERECLLRAADDRIAALRTESAIAGDREQVALCDRALNGDEAARDECARVLAEATREHAAE